MKRLLLATLLVLAAACADRTTTRYVGTVMHEAAPDSAGSLALTFFSRDDTGFTGVIELGAPARGTGSAYGWHEGGELHVVTVGAQGSDTIHWISTLAGPQLGGRFEVTGGDRAGQRGTWRARLMQGPPATAATLRLPAALPAPPLVALWPLVLLGVAGVLLVRWVRRAPRPPAMPDGTPWRAPPGPWVGLGGWLALFIYSQVVGIILWFFRVRTIRDDWVSGIGFGAALGGMEWIIVLEKVVQLVALPITIGGMVLLFRRSPLTPRYWFAWFVVSGVYLLVDALLTPWVQSEVGRLVGDEAMAAAGEATGRFQQLRQLLVTWVWALYWARSVRVRETFGARALDREFVATDPGMHPITARATDPAPARAPRSWRRIALWTVAATLVIIGLPIAFALLATRVTPYALPEGRDIRTHLAGRWVWESDSTGCPDAHTVSFDSSGKVMTIVGPDGDSTYTAVYDIEVLSRSTIRGAIRGETRMTDDGKPVVWDLVLTGPGEYRWKRADWSATPWSYTGPIRRCPRAQPADTTSVRAGTPAADTARPASARPGARP